MNLLNIEHEFKESPMYAYFYAKNVLKSRLKDESVFLKNMYFAVLYAKDLIGGRLPDEIEEVFFENNQTCSYTLDDISVESRVNLDQEFYLYEYSKLIGKLPEKLHNYMIVKSYCSNSEHIKMYFKSITLYIHTLTPHP